jgi:hypothetical protein
LKDRVAVVEAGDTNFVKASGGTLAEDQYRLPVLLFVSIERELIGASTNRATHWLVTSKLILGPTLSFFKRTFCAI